MDKNQAMDVIRQMYSKFIGTIQEHQMVQEAIKIINDELFKPVEKEEK